MIIIADSGSTKITWRMVGSDKSANTCTTSGIKKTIKFCCLIAMMNIAIILIAGCRQSVKDTVICVQLDPLQKVFTEESYFEENPDTVAVARGETATFQFVLKSAHRIQDLKINAENLSNGDQKIAATMKAFVGYVRAVNYTSSHSKDAVFPISDYYPDCLEEVESKDIPPMQNQPVWVSYVIPRDVANGDYTATLVFTGTANGKLFKIKKQVNVKVYPVTLPEQTLWISNWYRPNLLSQMNGNEPVEPYSDRYWELLAAMARTMREYGQNSYIIRGHKVFTWDGLCNIKRDGMQYSFDFTNFDKTVEIFIREGGLKRIEGNHLAWRMRDWNGAFGVTMPDEGRILSKLIDRPRDVAITKPLENDTAQIFLSQFLTALYSHLETKGWKEMYVQYVADEPVDTNTESYIRIANFVKKHMPGIPIIDAVCSPKLANSVDIWVPILDQYHRSYAFFQERQAAGKEIWFYTCVTPQGNYANRFMEQPLIQTRFLHWINFRYGATGYLHWGFNAWLPDNPHPTGDAWITYPAEGKIYSSIRLEAMRDGIADYELLKLLERKVPDKAKELASAVIKDFDDYDSNIRRFRQTRLELLKLLSE